MPDNKHKFKFSVVMSIYNTEKYIKEAINSLLNQTIGFEQNIQIILVNNATEDNSDIICCEYQRKYPNNIDYMCLIKNNGPSGGRNAGIPLIKGALVNFMDSDDIWAVDAFALVWNFYDQNRDKINCIACRQKCFEAWNKWHIYDYIYKEDRIVNVLTDYSNILFAASNTFINSKFLSDNKIRFDENLRYCEDMKFINQVVLLDMKYGALKSAVYYYRQRCSGDSQVQTYTLDESWYDIAFNGSCGYLIQYSLEKWNEVLPYIQYLVMSHLQGRLKTNLPNTISERIQKKYLDDIKKYLLYIEDKIIFEQKNIYKGEKLYAIILKYGFDFIHNSITIHDNIYFNNVEIFQFNDPNNIEIQVIEFQKDLILICGTLNIALPINYGEYIIQLTDGKVIYDLNVYFEENKFGLGLIKKLRHFKATIPLKNYSCLYFNFSYKHYKIEKLGISFKQHAKLNSDTSYYHNYKHLLTISSHNVMKIENYSFNKCLQQELLLLKEIYRNSHKKVFLMRIYMFFRSRIHQKDIWLITDRLTEAGDSGEILFRYLNNSDNINKKYDIYFVLHKDSADYARVKKYGKVLKAFSIRHFIKFCLSKNIISSYTNNWVIDPLHWHAPFLRDYFKFNFIHLQHGIIKDDISSSIGLHKKNIHMFVTSAQKEYESILNYPYGYDEYVVKLTGLPRYDFIGRSVTNSRKTILIAPTWRHHLVAKYDSKKDKYEYNPTFKNSFFYEFYNRLINDNRLLLTMSKYGYIGKLKLHPLMKVQENDFNFNQFFEALNSDSMTYFDLFKEVSMLISDYSSISFDFAYAEIPVIYAQFDMEDFYQNHTYQEGYFDYEKYGFGPVCYDYETTLEAIINCINSGTILTSEYKRRTDEFFAFDDNRNCERVLKEILKLE